MLKGWKQIDNYCISLLRQKYKFAENLHFHHSIVQCIDNKMLYKVIDGIVFIAKKSGIMGNYSMILYNTPIGYSGDYSEFLENGITIRNNEIIGIKDPFGKEYVYDCADFIKMKGSKYSRHRNTIKRYSPSFKNKNTIEVPQTVQKWSTINKSKHQIKLYKTIFKNTNKVTITRSYAENQFIGFSIIEMLNNNYGIILQRLINPHLKGITEPNIILHYNDCIQHQNCILNIGGDGGIKNMGFAKKKLNPISYVQINRIKTTKKITKKEYFAI